MNEHVVLVELNYQVTPINIRENLSSRRSELESKMKSSLAGKVFVVATCHRITFLTFVADDHQIIHLLQEMVPELCRDHLLVLDGEKATKHWFATACGLNSRTIGEHEILGQVRHAFAKAKDIGPELNELVKRGIHVGKRARTETKIGRYATSLTSITCQRILMKFPKASSIRVMIFGTGEMSRLVLQMLKSLSVAQIYIVSKDLARAKSVCTDRNMLALDQSTFKEKLDQVDILVGATWTENYLLKSKDVTHSFDQLYIDLGMPRNFDPKLEELNAVQLLDLNDLNETAETAIRKRNEEVFDVEQIIKQEVADFCNWLKFRALIPEIRSLRAEVDALRDRCCLRVHQELFYLSSQEKKQLCYQIRGLTQQHFSRILEVLKSGELPLQKATLKLEILHELYDAIDNIWHDFFAHAERQPDLLELLD